jgi:hypothetical protein
MSVRHPSVPAQKISLAGSAAVSRDFVKYFGPLFRSRPAKAPLTDPRAQRLSGPVLAVNLTIQQPPSGFTLRPDLGARRLQHANARGELEAVAIDDVVELLQKRRLMDTAEGCSGGGILV